MKFIGDVVAKWLKHEGADRKMKLVNKFTFIDSDDTKWVAPIGSIINGTSIPKFLWSTLGSPYVGDYRRASVVHDVECQIRKKPYRKVHRMFYDAMICDGMDKYLSIHMYMAVRLFGPRCNNKGKLTRATRNEISEHEMLLYNNMVNKAVDQSFSDMEKGIDLWLN
jgi:hypothetical protein